MANTLIDGYPQAEGAKWGSAIEKAGPASYTQVTAATPPTGGQALEASEFGVKYLEVVFGCLSDNGQYRVDFTPTKQGKHGVTAGILLWTVAAGGAEVAALTDLSARTVRLFARGR